MTNNVADSDFWLPRSEPVLAALREALHEVATGTISAVASDVPAYRDLDHDEQATLARSVELALLGFVALAGRGHGAGAPRAAALEAAQELGRGEARAGRTMDALLAAYRVGARVAWRGLAAAALAAGLPAPGLLGFAELVFTYIDQLSAASAAGHAEERAARSQVRQRRLERLAHGLATGAPAEELATAAAWPAPGTMAAVVLPADRVDRVLAQLRDRALPPLQDVADLGPGVAVVLLAAPDARLREGLARGLAGAPAVLGHTTPWRDVSGSVTRAARAWRLGLADGAGGVTGEARGEARSGEPGGGPGGARGGARPDAILATDDLLPELLVGSDPQALADLRARALAPLAGLRPETARRLAETLRLWLLLRGRRDRVAAALVVHPQTVRYRVAQLRDLFGDRLDDPRTALELTVALALDSPG